jgi:hypothetical protein
MPSIRIIMGGCQDFGVAAIIRATGARGNGNRSRTFTIDGPMTVEQVAALFALTQCDPQDDPVTIDFEPVGLDDRYAYEGVHDDELDKWWTREVYGN